MGQVEGITTGDKPDANVNMGGGIPDQHQQMVEEECKAWVATFLKSRELALSKVNNNDAY